MWLRLVPVFPALVSVVSAGFDSFEFSSNATNRICRNMKFKCRPPAICAHEKVADKYYCCHPGGKCTGSKEVCTHGIALAGQQLCDKNDTAFCCMKTSEQCTEIGEQINVCWSNTLNPVEHISEEVMNNAFSSLSSADPSATAYAVKLIDLLQLSTSTMVSSSTATSASSSENPSIVSSASSSPTSNTKLQENNWLSGGAIGGIIGGVVGGLALLGVVGFLLWRPRRAAKSQMPVVEVPAQEKYTYRAVEVPADVEGGKGIIHYSKEFVAVSKSASIFLSFSTVILVRTLDDFAEGQHLVLDHSSFSKKPCFVLRHHTPVVVHIFFVVHEQ
ncbi:hypothetical protein C7974DRAFT_377632 [Boeremia exigua]|uniref:uncharacterized protein n=1 Tax=Boeremia exigua TaxID=749465 RepID=UPI001E8EF343|nr:uncharacterized protein C7974DRAFT_377632 [Boeremia exigua]KAH6622002.1 hypothetical protein C7974DRAFT_377632 [Boeremia exigua]